VAHIWWGVSRFGVVLLGCYKTEEIYRHEYRGFLEARTGWITYRAWYRSERLHQSLGYQSPLDYARRAEKEYLISGLIYFSLRGSRHG